MHPYRALALQFWVAQSIFFAKIRWWDDVVDDVAMCFVCLCVCVCFFLGSRNVMKDIYM